jgi:hypothetical protein
LLFASAAAFSNTTTIGVSLVVSFYGFHSTVTEVEGGGNGAVFSFTTPSSLGILIKLNKITTQKPDKAKSIFKTKRKNL